MPFKKFDEEILSLTSETQNEYDLQNQLLLTKSKSLPEWKEYISQENKYNDYHKIISLGEFPPSAAGVSIIT